MLKSPILGLLIATALSTGAFAKSAFVECAVRTGQNASIFIRSEVTPTINGVALDKGDEVVVLDKNGACAGKATWTGETMSITVWGDDEMTEEIDGLNAGDPLRFVIYDASDNLIFGADGAGIDVGFDSEFPFNDGGVYEPDALFNVSFLDISGVPSIPPTAGVVDSFKLGSPYPNPFNPVTSFELEVVDAQDVAVRVYNAIGQQVAMLHDGFLTSGTQHEFQFEGAGLSSGMYLIRVTGEVFAAARSVVLLK